jgi:CheY-like chemotaxis protein
MALTILYAEDFKIVADAVRDMLGSEGWHVETCEDGLTALSLIKSGKHYDLLMLDNELPQMNGLELVRRARNLPHRRRMPIIVVSASEVGTEARKAGADVFLRKPQDMGLLVETVKDLVKR